MTPEELQAAIENIILEVDKINVREVFDEPYQSSKKNKQKENLKRSSKEFSINISDIVRYSILCFQGRNLEDIEENINIIENEKKELTEHELFINEKNNFITNFSKFCNALGVNTVNFKSGKPYVFKPKSLFVLYDILSNNSVYLHFLKNGINYKDINSTNQINENLHYFIKNEITDQQDYKRAMTNYYLYFLIDSNVEIGIRTKFIDILTTEGITSFDRLDIIEYYFSELKELNMEITTKLADALEKNNINYLENEKVSINLNLANYITHRDTKASVPKHMLLSLIINSNLISVEDLKEKELKYPKNITKAHHNKLINEINKALKFYKNKNNPSSDYFYITSD
ncbi:TPA: hypothetical protein ACF50J_001153 [Staphylococcus aureus]